MIGGLRILACTFKGQDVRKLHSVQHKKIIEGTEKPAVTVKEAM